MSAWSDLQRVALADVHAGWIVVIEADLMPSLRWTRRGRRWLAQSLVSALQLIDVVPPTWGDDGVVRSRPWLLTSLRADHRLVRVAGALRALSWIRRQLHRTTVLAIDQALGRELYGMLLAIHDDWSLSPLASQKLDGAGDDPERLVGVVDELGRGELVSYGEALHPAVADRLRLALAPDVEVTGNDVVASTAIDTVAAGMTWEQAA